MPVDMFAVRRERPFTASRTGGAPVPGESAMNILVVEDDFISRRLLCRYLEKIGNCDVAINGAEAVAAVHDALHAQAHYDLICLDIMMPGMSGQEALEAIRKLEIEHDIHVGQGARVIMTTALEDHKALDLVHADPGFREVHQHIIQVPPPRVRGKVDTDRVIAEAKLTDAHSIEDARRWLSSRETILVLHDRALIALLAALPHAVPADT